MDFEPDSPRSEFPASLLQRQVHALRGHQHGVNHIEYPCASLTHIARIADSELFTLQAHISIHRPLDLATLCAVYRTTALRHQALRSRVIAEDGHLFQTSIQDVDPESYVTVVEDVLPQELAERVALIDPLAPPTFRFAACGVTEESFDLVVSVHHLFVDAFALNVLVADVAQLYLEESGGATPSGSPSPSTQYEAECRAGVDHARRESELEAARVYWLTAVGLPSGIELPESYYRTAPDWMIKSLPMPSDSARLIERACSQYRALRSAVVISFLDYAFMPFRASEGFAPRVVAAGQALGHASTQTVSASFEVLRCIMPPAQASDAPFDVDRIREVGRSVVAGIRAGRVPLVDAIDCEEVSPSGSGTVSVGINVVPSATLVLTDENGIAYAERQGLPQAPRNPPPPGARGISIVAMATSESLEIELQCAGVDPRVSDVLGERVLCALDAVRLDLERSRAI